MQELKRQPRRVLLGSAILAGLVMIALLIFFLDDLLRLGRGTSRIVAVMPAAGDVRVGTRVWIAGKPAGRVTQIEFLPRSEEGARLALTLEIRQHLRPHIRRLSNARLTSDGLIGETVLDIVPGPATVPQLPEGDTLFSVRGLGLAQLMQRATRLDTAVAALNQEASQVAAPLLRREAELPAILRRFENAQRVFEALSADLATGAGAASLTTHELRASAAALLAITQELSLAITQSGERAGDVAHAVTRLQQRADALGASIAELDLVMPVSSSLRRFIEDPAIAHAVEGVQAQVDSLFAEIRRRPLRFLW